MTAALRHTEPPDPVVDAAPTLGKRGRPRGSIGPLSRWLQSQIARYKRQGASCRNTFLALSVVEGGNEDRFEVSEETADSLHYDLGVNIAGRVVSYESFRKAWQGVKLF